VHCFKASLANLVAMDVTVDVVITVGMVLAVDLVDSAHLEAKARKPTAARDQKRKQRKNKEEDVTGKTGKIGKDVEKETGKDGKTGNAEVDKEAEQVEDVENGDSKEQKLFLFLAKSWLELLDRPSLPRLSSLTTRNSHTSQDAPSEAYSLAKQQKCSRKWPCQSISMSLHSKPTPSKSH